MRHFGGFSNTMRKVLQASTFFSIFGEWAADKFDSRENVNSARQKHGKAFDFHATLLAGR